jgi:rubredoxin
MEVAISELDDFAAIFDLEDDTSEEKTKEEILKEEFQEMFECPLCGSSVGEEATSCPNCGAFFEGEETEVVEEVQVVTKVKEIKEVFECPLCGVEVSSEAISCPKCDAEFLEDEVDDVILDEESEELLDALSQDFDEIIRELKARELMRKEETKVREEEPEVAIIPDDLFEEPTPPEKVLPKVPEKAPKRPIPLKRPPIPMGIETPSRGMVNGLVNGRGRVNGLVNGRGRVNGLVNGRGRVNGLVNGRGRVNGLVKQRTRQWSKRKGSKSYQWIS